MDSIVVIYEAVDGHTETRTFDVVEAARDFAFKMVGDTPECGIFYAISADGVGKVTVEGCSLTDLFPHATDPSGSRTVS